MQHSVALVGCGGWGKNLGRTLFELGSLRAVVDPNSNGADLAGRASVPLHHDIAPVLADRSITGVVIATPAATHETVAAQALRAGKHVFVEKPITLDLAAAESLAALAADRSRILMVGHVMQFHPAFRALLELVSAGELGALRYIVSNRLNFGHIRSHENVLWSFAPHDISMILALAGAEPTTVRATGMAMIQEGIHDLVTTRLSFDSGLEAVINSSWLHPEKEAKLVVVGDRASAVFDDRQPWSSKLVLHRSSVQWSDGHPRAMAGEREVIEVSEAEPLKEEMRHFLGAIEARHPPLTDADEAIRVLRVLRAAQQSLSEQL